jgi:hypothetical protein
MSTDLQLYAVAIVLLLLVVYWMRTSRSTLDPYGDVFTIVASKETIKNGDKIRIKGVYEVDGIRKTFAMRALETHELTMMDGSVVRYRPVRFPSGSDPSYTPSLVFTVSGLTPLSDDVPGYARFTNSDDANSCSNVNSTMRLTTEIDGVVHRAVIGYNPSYGGGSYERFELDSGELAPLAADYINNRAFLFLIPEPVPDTFAPYLYFTPVNEYGEGTLSGETIYADSKTGMVDTPVRIGSAIDVTRANKAIREEDLATCGAERVLQCPPMRLQTTLLDGKKVYGCMDPLDTNRDSLHKGHMTVVMSEPWAYKDILTAMTGTYPDTPPNLFIQKLV